MTGFATITRPGLELAAGETEQLDLIMEVGGLVEQIHIVVSPREVYRWADAVVQLRVVESLGIALKDGFPTTEHRVAIIAVIKPHEQKERPAWRSQPPNDRIAVGSSFTVLQRNSETVPYRDRLATGKSTPVQTGEEYVAFLEDSCRRLWNITLRFPVRNGRVYVPRGEPGYSDEWNG